MTVFEYLGRQPTGHCGIFRFRVVMTRNAAAAARFRNEALRKRFSAVRRTGICVSSLTHMKSMADFGTTREWDQLRVRGSKRKKILESHSTKSNAFLPNIAIEADCTQVYV